MDLETITRKKAETKEERAALSEKAIRQIKDRKAKATKTTGKGKGAGPAPAQKAAQKTTAKK